MTVANPGEDPGKGAFTYTLMVGAQIIQPL